MARQLMQSTTQQQFRIDWVLVDVLAIGPAPRSPRHLDLLTDAGIQAVLSLCEYDEAPPPRISTLVLHTSVLSFQITAAGVFPKGVNYKRH